MIGYVTLGTNDLPRAAAFYDALLAKSRRFMEGRAFIVRAVSPTHFAVIKPHDGKAGNGGNGTMVAPAGRQQGQGGSPARFRPVAGGTDEGPAVCGDGFMASAISAIWTATSSNVLRGDLRALWRC